MKNKKEWFWGAGIGFLALAILTPLIVQAASGTIWTLTGKGSRRGTVEWTVASPTVGSAANLNPGTANAHDIGTSSAYVQYVHAKGVDFSVVVDTTTAPDYAGLIAVNSAYTLYVATGTGTGAWVAVGGQS